jgi:hypothetical protein
MKKKDSLLFIKIYFILINVIFLSSCAVKQVLADDNRKLTEHITDRQNLNWDSTYICYGAPDTKHRAITFLDTFIIVKPVIDVKKIFNNDYFPKIEILKDSLPDFWMKRNVPIEQFYELDWYAFIHHFFSHALRYSPHHYLASIPDSGYEIIVREVKKIEFLFDNNNIKEFSMPDSLYTVLSGYAGQYYIFNSIKERYWSGEHTNVKQGDNFIQMRIFVFNKKTKRIVYYNIANKRFNLNPSLSYAFSSDFNNFADYVIDLFKTTFNPRFINTITHSPAFKKIK